MALLSAYPPFRTSAMFVRLLMLLLLGSRHRMLPRAMTSAHAYLLAFLIGSGFTQSPSPVSVVAFPTPAAHRPTRAPLQQQASHDCRLRTTRRLSSPLTTLHARRGGKGRRRGRTRINDPFSAPGGASGSAAVAVRETPPTTASAAATLAVQHAAHHELLGVAYTHRALLRPAVLSQALLRVAKVCDYLECLVWPWTMFVLATSVSRGRYTRPDLCLFSIAV